MSKASKEKRTSPNLEIYKFIDIPRLTFIIVLCLGLLIAAVLFLLDLDQILLNKGTVDFSSLIIATITMSGLSIATYTIGQLDRYTKKRLLTVIIGFFISDILIFFNLIYAGFISINFKLNTVLLYWFFFLSFLAGYVGLIVFFASTAGLMFLFLKLKFPYKVKKPYGNIIVLLVVIAIVIIIFLYGRQPNAQSNILSSTPPLNGQFVNFWASAGCMYTYLPAGIVDGNAIGGNLTLFYVGNLTLHNTIFTVDINFGVYPSFKQINLTFNPVNVLTKISNPNLENYRTGLYNKTIISINKNLSYTGSYTLSVPNNTSMYMPAGEYLLRFSLNSVNMTSPLASGVPYELFTVDGAIANSQNFLYNFGVYLKAYPNTTSFCTAEPSFC